MSATRPSVLLVDDVEANLIALEAQLSSLDCTLVRASSGNEALRQLLKRKFAVMLLDVQMPDMDGFEVARHARRNPDTRDVPIVFVTALNETEEHVIRGYDTGAFDFLFKPVSPHVLRSKVRVFLDLFLNQQRLNDEIAAHRKTLVELERLSRFKSQFLANMSHELRTPLNAIIGFSEVLSDGEGDQALNALQREHIGYVLESGRHLLDLINDVLDLSKIEAGRIELHREWSSPSVLVEAACEIARSAALKQGVSLSIEGPPSGRQVFVDPVRIKQVLLNLISNGIKFTPAGGAVRVRTVDDDVDRVTFAVEDTGIGIRAEDLPRLFREFERIESPHGPKPEGTGLGLALTRRLVELHGGVVHVESEPGKGSRFTVLLPRADAVPADR